MIPTMEKRLRKPVAATFNCPELSLLPCIGSLIIGEYTNQKNSTDIGLSEDSGRLLSLDFLVNKIYGKNFMT